MARGSHGSQRAWSYVAANASQPVLEQTLGDALRLAGKTWPSKPALIQGALETSRRRKWTFQDIIEQSEQVARALLSLFEPGDHVAIWMANQPEWLLVEFGAALAGLTLVTVNPAFLDEELIFVLKQSKARGIVVQDVFRDRNLPGMRSRSLNPQIEGARCSHQTFQRHRTGDIGDPRETFGAIEGEATDRVHGLSAVE